MESELRTSGKRYVDNLAWPESLKTDWPFVVIFAGVFLFVVFGILTDYSRNFQHAETAAITRYATTAPKTNLTPVIDRPLHQQIFSRSYEYLDRARYVNNLFWIANIKLRRLLFEIVPPHPSFHVGTILFLVASPLLLFLWLRREGQSLSTAYAVSALYMASPGFLSGLTMYFHMAKPIVSLAAIALLFSFSSLNRAYWSTPEPKKLKKSLYCVAVSCAVLLFCDEISFFLLVLPIAFYPKLFFRSRHRAAFLCALLVPVFFFFFFVTFIAIPLGDALTLELAVQRPRGWWAYAFSMNQGLGNWEWRGFLQFIDHVTTGQNNLPDLALSRTMIGSFALLPLGALYALMPEHFPERRLLLLGTLLYLAFVLFLSLISTHNLVVPSGTFYSGALASLFLALLAGGVLGVITRLSRYLAALALGVCVVFSFQQFRRLNGIVLEMNTETSAQNLPHNGALGTLTYDMVKEAWLIRNNPEELDQLFRTYPTNAAWLYHEINAFKKEIRR